MTVLSDVDIRHECNLGGLLIKPFDEQCLQPASYDLRLGNEFVRKGWKRDVTIDEDESFYIKPGEFVLAHTQETISLPDYLSGEVKGRSSLGRRGVIPHTAGWVDPGFSGEITLEFVNHSKSRVELQPGQRVAQIVFSYLNNPASTGYGDKDDAKYQGQTGATESRMHEDTDI